MSDLARSAQVKDWATPLSLRVWRSSFSALVSSVPRCLSMFGRFHIASSSRLAGVWKILFLALCKLESMKSQVRSAGSPFNFVKEANCHDLQERNQRQISTLLQTLFCKAYDTFLHSSCNVAFRVFPGVYQAPCSHQVYPLCQVVLNDVAALEDVANLKSGNVLLLDIQTEASKGLVGNGSRLWAGGSTQQSG